MARGKRTKPEKVLQIQALTDAGEEMGEVSRMTDTPYDTVWGIVKGRRPWVQLIDNTPLLKQYRSSIKTRMEAKASILAEEMLDEIGKSKATGSLSQKAIAYGILRTHGRLDAGESTENIAVVHRQDVDDLDLLAMRLATRLASQGNGQGHSE